MKEPRLGSRSFFSRLFCLNLPRLSQRTIGQMCWWRWGCTFSAEIRWKAVHTPGKSTASSHFFQRATFGLVSACIERIIHISGLPATLRADTDRKCCLYVLHTSPDISLEYTTMESLLQTCQAVLDCSICQSDVREEAEGCLPQTSCEQICFFNCEASWWDLTMGFHYTEPQHSRKSVRR